MTTFDDAGFTAWMVERGYNQETIVKVRTKARLLVERGVLSLDLVDELFFGWNCQQRSPWRYAIRLYGEFLEASS